MAKTKVRRTKTESLKTMPVVKNDLKKLQLALCNYLLVNR